jgi:putative oxidoreductase
MLLGKGVTMKIASTVARLLLGLMFTVFGLNGFLHFIPNPPVPPGLMHDFVMTLFESGFYVVIFGAQLICGLLLLANQYVPLAIVVLGAILVNILTFHATMNPQGFPPAILALILWVLTAWPIRASFAPIFARRAG